MNHNQGEPLSNAGKCSTKEKPLKSGSSEVQVLKDMPAKGKKKPQTKKYRRPKPKRLGERIEARLPIDVRRKLDGLLTETGDSGSSYLRRLIIKDLKDQGRW